MNRPATTLLVRHTLELDDYPVDCAWSPDGRELAVAGGAGSLQRVLLATGSALRLGSHDPGLLAVSWQSGPQQQLATTGQDGSVRLWDAGASTPGEGRAIHRGMAWPLGLAFAPGGKALAVAVKKDVLVFGATGEPLHRFADQTCNLTQLLWRNDRELVAAGNGAAFLLQLPPQQTTTQLAFEGAPMTLSLSPDARIVAAGTQDGTVYFRYLASQKKSRMSGYEGKVTQTSWSGNSRYLATAASGANVIIVWDFGGKGPEGSRPLQLESHGDRIESLAFQPGSNLLASGGRDWRLVLWRPGPGKAAAAQASAQQPLDVQLLAGPVSLLRWSPDGRHLAVAQASGLLQLFELRG
ncbi:MAG TPA: hypothetical protein VGO41_04025 [Steroidobacteraceae bacterium]|nr:hypothetical protein [Steroidobacteraceae bacterium]